MDGWTFNAVFLFNQFVYVCFQESLKCVTSSGLMQISWIYCVNTVIFISCMSKTTNLHASDSMKWFPSECHTWHTLKPKNSNSPDFMQWLFVFVLFYCFVFVLFCLPNEYLSKRVVSSLKDCRKCEAAVDGCWRRPFPLQPSSLCWM